MMYERPPTTPFQNPPQTTTFPFQRYTLVFQQHQDKSIYDAWTRLKNLIQRVPRHCLDLWSLTQIFYDHVDDYIRMDLDFAADGNLRELNGEEAWEAIENFAQGQKELDNPPNIISEQEVANLKTQAKRLFGNEIFWVEMHREVEETLGTLIEVEPLDETQLEDLFLNICNHDIPLSSREVPSFDEPKTQPQPLPNCPPLDISIGDKKGPESPIKPHSPDSFRMKMIENDWELESKEVSFLRRGLNLPVRPKDVEKLECVDVDETFSLVVKLGTIRTVLSLVASRHWSVHQLDVKNAFLHGDLSEMVYMHQPPGFRDSAHPDYVCLLHRHGMDIAYLLLYVDDIVLTASSQALDVFISEEICFEILERAHMVNCNPIRTPTDTESKLGIDGDLVSNPTLYRSLAGSLQYLTFTRPNISYAVHQVSLYMHDPRELHFLALKRILRYVRGTLDYGLQLFSSSTIDLVAYSDADWAGCPTTRRSTSGYYVFLGNNLLSWSFKHQPALSRSSAESEYRGVANAVAETCWLHNLLRELHTLLSSATLVYCDNVSAVYLSRNPVQHQCTKHIEIDIHLVRDLVAAGQVRVLYVSSCYQFTDIFTKGLPSALFEEFRTSLSIRCPPAPTAREC
ncbi:ribonuclease H-like domain-containing protein [Tanacetum coccineum]